MIGLCLARVSVVTLSRTCPLSPGPSEQTSFLELTMGFGKGPKEVCWGRAIAIAGHAWVQVGVY